MKYPPDSIALALLKKYRKLYWRYQKTIRLGQFFRFPLYKKQSLLLRLSRYERQLKGWGISLGVGACMLLSANTLLGQPVPVGSEFLVNTYLTGNQGKSTIAMDADGDFVVAWQTNGQESGQGIYARRYNNAGVAQGGEFHANTCTDMDQDWAGAAMDPDGNFWIVWHSQYCTPNFDGVYGQRYDNTGNPVGGEFQFNTSPDGPNSRPAIAMDPEGNFIVAGDNSDGSYYGIYAGRYNNAGILLGSLFPVSTYTTNRQAYAATAMDSNGNFVICWQSRDQDGSGDGVFARRYDSSGVPQGDEFMVNEFTTDHQRYPAIAMDDDGDFVITWQSFGQDGDNFGIYAKRYNGEGVPQGGEFQVNTITASVQDEPAIANSVNGDFVIAWQSLDQDGSENGVYARAFNNLGIPDGNEFQVNTSTTHNQILPSIAVITNGNFVISWTSNQTGVDSDVYAQRYSPEPCTPQNWYADTDGDNYGAGAPILACDQPPNTVTDNTDCNDNAFGVNPGAQELCNNIDDDCNDHVDDYLAVCPVPSGLATTNITATSATLNWTQVPCGKKYKIRYIRLSPLQVTNVRAGQTGSKNISGLTPGSNYKWTITTKCPSNIYSASSPFQFFTTAGMQLQESGENVLADYDGRGLQLSLQPNPASGIVRVAAAGKNLQQVVISDPAGRIIMERAGLDDNSLEMEISHLAPGIYFVHATSGRESGVVPLVIME